MISLETLPSEIITEIVYHMHDGFYLIHDGLRKYQFGRYDLPVGKHELYGINRRMYLASLRAVNRMFHRLITPLLFEHAFIFSGDNEFLEVNDDPEWLNQRGSGRLKKLSMEPSICKLVRRLEITVRPLDFDDRKYWRDSQRKTAHLRYITRISTLIHSALPRFSNVTVLRLGLGDLPYRNPNDCLIQDTRVVFESFPTAICRSGLDKLEELDLSLSILYDFKHFVDDKNEIESSSTRVFFKQLKRLCLHVEYNVDCDEDDLEDQIGRLTYLQELLPLAPNLDCLKVQGPTYGWNRYFRLSTESLLPHCHLQVLNLADLIITKQAITPVIERCKSLQEVVLHGVALEYRSGTWDQVLTTLSTTSIIAFDIDHCCYHTSKDGYFRTTRISTSRVEDIDACKLVYARVLENMSQAYGSSYVKTATKAKHAAAELVHLQEDREHIRAQGSLDDDQDMSDVMD